MKFATKLGFLVALCTLLTFFNLTLAHATSEGDFMATTELASDIGKWVNGLEAKPKSMAIFSLHLNAPMDEGLKAPLVGELTKNINAGKNTRFIDCEECRAPMIEVQGDRLVISKGAPDLKQLQELGKKVGADTFMSIEVFKSKLSLMAQVTILQASTGDMLASDSFRVSNLDFNDAAMQFMLGVGPALPFSSSSSSTKNGGSYTFDLTALEELGFGKGGLTVGAFVGLGENNPFYIMPTLALRNRFGSTRMYGLTSLAVGYGISGNEKGVAVAFGYHFFISSFTFIHVKAFGMIPTGNSSYYGGSSIAAGALEIGVALGR